tara:strand:- start:197 stop:340 length:144 start_codon:yes stop_codon:yes gene_type:complete
MEVDAALDPIGIRIEKGPTLCGTCMAEMIQVNSRTIKCPKCGKIYEE